MDIKTVASLDHTNVRLTVNGLWKMACSSLSFPELTLLLSKVSCKNYLFQAGGYLQFFESSPVSQNFVIWLTLTAK